MAGTLFIVGTPIGNLEDVSMRALRVLREVDLIAAEDTRRTGRLLQHYSIATPATSLHEHNERGKGPHLIARLQAGESIALVSDAGMPLVSDPGAWLVRAAREAGVPIQVVPGPSAVTAALAAAGVSGPFVFLGFPPASGRQRADWIARLGGFLERVTAVFFEAPHRMRKTAGDLRLLLGDRPIMVAKELTKVHELLVEQPIKAWLETRSEETQERGEYVVVIPWTERAAPSHADVPSDHSLLIELGELTNNTGLKPRAAAKRLAKKYNVSAHEIYALHASHKQ